jgi:hypothetical protein
VTVTNPGDQSGTVGTAVHLDTEATDSSTAATLSYTARGLPPGLSISPTGLISGTPTAVGSYSVTVTVSDDAGASGTASFPWTISPGAGGACSGQQFANPGFESGTTGWSQSSGVIATDDAHPRSGTGYAWLGGYGTSHTDTLSQAVTVPPGCTAILTYYLAISTEEKTSAPQDTLAVAVDGATEQTFSNGDQGSGYVKRTLVLTGSSGTVTVTWTGTENSSLKTSFFLDDTALTLS